MFKKLKQNSSFQTLKSNIGNSRLNPKNYNWQKIKEFLKIFNLGLLSVLIIMLVFLDDDMQDDNEEIAFNVSGQVIEYLDEYYFAPEEQEDDCNVAGIELRGVLITYVPNENIDELGYPLIDEIASENIITEINEAESDNNVKAIILEIDSVGGGPVAAEEIADALKRAEKPTVAVIREYGNSAAYYAATGADIIFASVNSDVGGIGVTMSYVDNAQKNKKDGLTYNQLSSGKFKDMFDPNKILTADEKQLLMRDVKILHENFVKAVSENRNLDIEKVKKLADGSSMPGEMALEKGLIDKIGGIYEAKEYLKEKISEDVKICW